MKRELKFCANSDWDGKSLLTLCKQELKMSASLIRAVKRIENGFTVNGEPVFVNSVVRVGDEVNIIIDDGSENSDNVEPCKGEPDIVYEDEDILVVNKPPLLAVHPSLGNRDRSLAGEVVGHYNRLGERFVFRCLNRLDKGTSGLTVIAKNAYSGELLAQQLHSEAFFRQYIAVVEGELKTSGSVNAPIGRCADSVIRRCVDNSGAPAQTDYEAIETDGESTLVRLTLHTGRTHQIRVHMAHIGHPLVGDFLYGKESDRIPRTALHSSNISLLHPITKQRMTFESPLPDDMLRLITNEKE